MQNDDLIHAIQALTEKIGALNDLLTRAPPTAPAVTPNDYTFFSWLTFWLSHEHKQNVSPDTYAKDCGIIRKHILSQTQYDLPLSEFKTIHLQAVITNVKVSRQRVMLANMVTAALRSAYNNEFMAKDVTRTFKKPSHEYEEDRALTVEEETKLTAALDGFLLEDYIRVLLYAGLRRNEALGLQRKHIDFDRDEIHVEQQVNMKNAFTSKLKTKTSRRIVKMFPKLKTALLKYRDFPPETRLFLWKPDYVTRTFATFCERNGILDFTLKSCRTTFATRCEEMGIPDMIVQVWMGHSNIKTTKKHYQKVNPDYIEREFQKALKPTEAPRPHV